MPKKTWDFRENNVQIPFICKIPFIFRVFLGLFSFSDLTLTFFGDDSEIVLSCCTR